MVESFQAFGDQVMAASVWGAGLAVGLGLAWFIVRALLAVRNSR